MVIEIQRINESVPMAPIASETNETDEIARKMLQNVSSLVDDESNQSGQAASDVPATGSGGSAEPPTAATAAAAAPATVDPQKPNGGAIKKTAAFVYALPAEVLKTSLNRHQRGIMDARIYQLLTKKEIFLPQVCVMCCWRLLLARAHQITTQPVHFAPRTRTDLGERSIPRAVHSSALSAGPPDGLRHPIQSIPPEVSVFKNSRLFQQRQGGEAIEPTAACARSINIRMDLVAEERFQEIGAGGCRAAAVGSANHPAFVVWHGVRGQDATHEGLFDCDALGHAANAESNVCAAAYAGAGLRAKVSAFCPSIGTACASNGPPFPIRYIITNPDRKMLTRLELDAFLATAFSQDLDNVDYTQELVVSVPSFAAHRLRARNIH